MLDGRVEGRTVVTEHGEVDGGSDANGRKGSCITGVVDMTGGQAHGQ